MTKLVDKLPSFQFSNWRMEFNSNLVINFIKRSFLLSTWEERERSITVPSGVSECGRRKATEFFFLEAQILAVQDVPEIAL